MRVKPGVLIVSALLVLAPLIAPSWVVFILTKALFMFIIVMGVAQLLRGGQVTFGHAMFYAAGAYTVGFSVRWFEFREILVLLPMGALMGLILAALAVSAAQADTWSVDSAEVDDSAMPLADLHLQDDWCRRRGGCRR